MKKPCKHCSALTSNALFCSRTCASSEARRARGAAADARLVGLHVGPWRVAGVVRVAGVRAIIARCVTCGDWRRVEVLGELRRFPCSCRSSKRPLFGVLLTVAELATVAGINRAGMAKRLARMSVEEAVALGRHEPRRRDDAGRWATRADVAKILPENRPSKPARARGRS